MIGRVSVPGGSFTLEDDGRWSVDSGDEGLDRTLESCLALALPPGGPEEGEKGYRQLNALASAVGRKAQFEPKDPAPRGVAF